MGRDLYDASPAARAIFDRADAVLGRPISTLCFEGPADQLADTANAQPAIYVASLACLEAAREAGVASDEPSFVAGHSLGEYTALAAAGALTFEGGLRLVAERGRLMASAAREMPGAMAALLGLEAEAAEAACADAGAEVCNVNAPGQIVIGGTPEAVSKACDLAQQRGARRAIMLDVSGAFHTSLMRPAVEPFAQAVSSIGISAPRVPFISNRTGEATADPAEIADALVYQLTHPVRWTACVEHMVSQGVRSVIEFGPGKVLTGLLKRIAPEITLRNINSKGSLQA